MTKPVSSTLPIILVFDTTQRDQTAVALLVGQKVEIIIEPVRAQEVQQLAKKLLSQQKVDLAGVDYFAVLTGPGSFTGTRIGVTAANTYGWLLNKRVMGAPGDNLDAAIVDLLAGQVKLVQQAEARY